MNGRMHNATPELEICLKRGPSGLGFNIVGGTDQQYISNDSGIYVTKIKEQGAAALDGRLQEGDRILAINGCELQNLSHQEAVELFRTAGEDVRLRVLQGHSAQMNGPAGSRGGAEPSISLLGVLAVSGALALAAMVYLRFKHRIGMR
ncbi:synaptojanin-2-binding protein [Acipenser oxyrinchus oxyrinchus]|uniref:Synaptojanin-2-binding protein n=1 Tax=Acipenser oxyrinchus oxyrinchus TaxID=40147 RepID=A0AAD8G169_ACIOX|nr:synaptojanin-2-binding protein [Acipenser oxyrinchus oxyrinchus]